MSSTLSLAYRRDRSAPYLPSVGSPGLDGNLSPLPRYHPAPSRNEVAIVQPVLVRLVIAFRGSFADIDL
jgi:catabolite repression protein CreC